MNAMKKFGFQVNGDHFYTIATEHVRDKLGHLVSRPLQGSFRSALEAVDAADYISGRFATLAEAVANCRHFDIVFRIGFRGVEEVYRVNRQPTRIP